MELEIMYIVQLVLFLIFAVYFFLILKWTILWLIYPETWLLEMDDKIIKVSVVVAVRNEAINIKNLLEALLLQNYPSESLQIIISNDHSNDETVKEVMDFIAKKGADSFPVFLLNSQDGDQVGKKAALERAIKFSTGELIIVTDADCRMPINWVRSFVHTYVESNAPMITGFVRIEPLNSFFAKLQAFEFLSLSGTGAVSVINRKPLMCNGANLAFTRQAFDKAGGYSYGKNISSGDDTFLMLKIAANDPGRVVFNKCKDGIVSTGASNSLKELFHQRIRWAAKVKFYKEGYIKYTGILIATVNIMLVTTLVLGIAGKLAWELVLFFWFTKAAVDFIFLVNLTFFANQWRLLLLFLPAVLLYPFYAIIGIIPALLNTGYIWKERKLK
ncbi:MAG: glycosyltransferase [Bacteroidetes bacterium]|nr:glycosyltransferase [Bacteroidota bacterium]